MSVCRVRVKYKVCGDVFVVGGVFCTFATLRTDVLQNRLCDCKPSSHQHTNEKKKDLLTPIEPATVTTTLTSLINAVVVSPTTLSTGQTVDRSSNNYNHLTYCVFSLSLSLSLWYTHTHTHTRRMHACTSIHFTWSKGRKEGTTIVLPSKDEK